MTENVLPRSRAGRVSRCRGIVAAVIWLVGSAQFLALHLVVQSAWGTPYSWADNNISDLAETGCRSAPVDGRWICSPLSEWMNGSFVATGVCLVAGTVLASRTLGRTVTARVLLAATGAGWVLVGLAPADVDENLHVLGAVVIFLLGNAALVLFGIGLRSWPRALRLVSVVLGAAGLAAAFLHLGGTYLGLGTGGMERVTAFPVLVWVVVAGIGVTGRLKG